MLFRRFLVASAIGCAAASAAANDFSSWRQRFVEFGASDALGSIKVEVENENPRALAVAEAKSRREAEEECRRRGGKEFDCLFGSPQWIILDRDVRWPAGTLLRVCFFDGDKRDRRHVVSLFAEIVAVTNLKLDTSIFDCSSRDKAQIRVKFDTGRACSSVYGKDALTEREKYPHAPTMRLCSMKSPWSPAMEGVVRHEFMHALGFAHEHLRKECFNDVKLDELKKSKLFSEDPVANAKAAEYAVQQLVAITSGTASEYDPDSIMQYTLDPSFLVEKPVCTWRRQKSVLSKRDWEGLRANYPAGSGSSSETFSGTGSLIYQPR